jgi:hypothetical protein
MSVWQGVAVDSLKFHLGSPCLTAVSGVAHSQGWPTRRACGLQLSSPPLDTPRGTPIFVSLWTWRNRGPRGPELLGDLDRKLVAVVAAGVALVGVERRQAGELDFLRYDYNTN